MMGYMALMRSPGCPSLTVHFLFFSFFRTTMIIACKPAKQTPDFSELLTAVVERQKNLNLHCDQLIVDGPSGEKVCRVCGTSDPSTFYSSLSLRNNQVSKGMWEVGRCLLHWSFFSGAQEKLSRYLHHKVHSYWNHTTSSPKRNRIGVFWDTQPTPICVWDNAIHGYGYII